MKNLFLAITLLVSAASVTTAQTPEPTASHLQAATDLIVVLKVEAGIRAGVDLAMKEQLQASPELAPFEGVMRQFVEKYVNLKNFGPQLSRIYTDSFSEAELREMIAFYKTPTGQKAISLMPEMTRKSGEIGAKVVQDHQEELNQMIATRMQELEQQAPPKPSKPPEPAKKP